MEMVMENRGKVTQKMRKKWREQIGFLNKKRFIGLLNEWEIDFFYTVLKLNKSDIDFDQFINLLNEICNKYQ